MPTGTNEKALNLTPHVSVSGCSLGFDKVSAEQASRDTKVQIWMRPQHGVLGFPLKRSQSSRSSQNRLGGKVSMAVDRGFRNETETVYRLFPAAS